MLDPITQDNRVRGFLERGGGLVSCQARTETALPFLSILFVFVLIVLCYIEATASGCQVIDGTLIRRHDKAA